MGNFLKILFDIPYVFFRSHPVLVIKPRKVNRPTVAAQSFAAVVQKIFVKIGHHEFSYVSIDRFAVAQYSMVTFTDCAPTVINFEWRNNMVEVAAVSFKVQD